jgi:predicted Fe-Mo cluster-binding NifX family protein
MALTVCVPVTAAGEVDARWGRAARVALATVEEGEVTAWQVVEVGWDVRHDLAGEGRHHAEVARFVAQRGVGAVLAAGMGEPMRHMLGRMGVEVRLGAAGDARAAVAAYARSLAEGR